MKGALKSSWVGDGRQMSVFGGVWIVMWEERVVFERAPFESTEIHSRSAMSTDWPRPTLRLSGLYADALASTPERTSSRSLVSSHGARIGCGCAAFGFA